LLVSAKGQEQQIAGAKQLIFFDSPANILLEEFSVARESENYTGSFSSYYRETNTVNAFFKHISTLPVNHNQLLVSPDNLFKSLLLLEDTFELSFDKVPYGKVFNENSTRELDDHTQQEIERLYAKEYEVYQALARQFSHRWDEFRQRTKANYARFSNAVIHVGPPKTGTSAIQSWLNQNRKALGDKGIDYPAHGSDSNGISAGNFAQLISYTKSKTPYFDKQRLDTLLNKMGRKPTSTVLLSSEHFYYFLPWLFTYLPSAQYIFFIRHPIPLFESGYHQQIKRHRRTNEYRAPNQMFFNNLNVISRLSREFGVTVTYKFYDQIVPGSQGIYEAIASCFKTFIDPPAVDTKINSKFTPGALTLMREANKFASKNMRFELDRWLQCYSEGKPDFSLTSKDALNKISQHLMEQVEKLTASDPSLEREQLLALIKNYQTSSVAELASSIDNVQSVLQTLKRDYPALAYTLIAGAVQSKKSDILGQHSVVESLYGSSGKLKLPLAYFLAEKWVTLQALRRKILKKMKD